MPTWINKANLCILVWCLYFSQGTLFPKGTIFSQILLAFLLIISFYNVIIANLHYKLASYFRGLNFLILLFTTYGIYSIFIDPNPINFDHNASGVSYLKSIYLSLLPIYTFFIFFKEKQISEKMFFFWIFVFFILAAGEYSEKQKEMLIAALSIKNSHEEFTNNAGYLFLALIPACVFLQKKPIIQYLALGCCLIYLFMGMKRGAILIGVFCLIWFLWYNLKEINVKLKTSYIFLSLILCFASYQLVQKQMEESLYFQKRIEDTLEGHSSGRNYIYSKLISYYWNDTNPLQFVFGSGANSTLKIADHYAHCDWIEIAVNQGVLGLLVYLLYWFYFIKECQSNKYKPQIKLALQLIFIIYFIKTIFSMSYNNMPIAATFILGYCLAQENENEQIFYIC